jgi:hypothetical protein
MINYYKQINTNVIYLVHGEFEGKIELAKDLKREFEKGNQTTKVIVVNKNTIANL